MSQRAGETPPPRTRGGPDRQTFAVGLLASSLTAAFLNLAVSLPDHPLALRAFSALLLPLVATLALFAGGSLLLLFAVGLPLRRLGFSAASIALALGALTTLLAGLGPLAGVLERDVTRVEALALLGLAVVALASAFLSVLLLAEHWRERKWSGPLASAATLMAPLGAALVLWLSWLACYAPEDVALAGEVAELGSLALGGAAAIFVLARVLGGLSPLAVLAPLFAVVLASPLLAALPYAAAPVHAAAAADPCCVVLISVDTLRHDFVDGASAAFTPAIASLLRDSVVFENARAAAPWTKPSLATLLTGLSPLVHRATTLGQVLPEEVTTLAEYFAKAGYETAGIGLNEHVATSFGFSQGFDTYAFPARGDYGLSFGSMLLSRAWPDRYPETRVSTTGIADVAIAWLRAHRDRPFFLWVHILDPHWPYAPPGRLAPPPRDGASVPPSWGDQDTVTRVQAGTLRLGDADKEVVRDLYRSEIRYVDENIARVLGALRELGLYDRSLIAFASDHGEEFWEHGRYEHGHSLFDELLRVPLAFKLPGASVRARIAAAVSTESLTPTLVDLLGLEPAAGGFSSPSLRGHWDAAADAPSAQALFASGTYYYGEQRMVLLDGRWKYVVANDTGRRDLYDLAADPGELHSLTSSEPERVAQAEELLTQRLAASELQQHALGLAAGPTLALPSDLRRRLGELGYLDSDPAPDAVR